MIKMTMDEFWGLFGTLFLITIAGLIIWFGYVIFAYASANIRAETKYVNVDICHPQTAGYTEEQKKMCLAQEVCKSAGGRLVSLKFNTESNVSNTSPDMICDYSAVQESTDSAK